MKSPIPRTKLHSQHCFKLLWIQKVELSFCQESKRKAWIFTILFYNSEFLTQHAFDLTFWDTEQLCISFSKSISVHIAKQNHHSHIEILDLHEQSKEQCVRVQGLIQLSLQSIRILLLSTMRTGSGSKADCWWKLDFEMLG